MPPSKHGKGSSNATPDAVHSQTDRSSGRGGGDRSLLLVVGLALLGTLLILLREINYGPGVNWDSVMYMSVAENLVAGKGFVTFQGSPLTIWPPLFPMLLTPGVFLGFDAQDSAGFVNAAAFGLTILFSGLWLHNRIASGTLILWATLAVMLSVPLTLAAVVVMSESPFVLFSLLALIWIEKFLQSHARSSLIWAAIFTALACLTRYMGGTLAIAVALLLLLQRGVPPRTKIGQLAVYSFIAVTPVLLWLSRNMLVAGSTTGGLVGGYWEPVTPLLENGRFTAQTLLDWIVPASELPPGIQDIATVPATAGLIGKRRGSGSPPSLSLRRRGGRSDAAHTFWRFQSGLYCLAHCVRSGGRNRARQCRPLSYSGLCSTRVHHGFYAGQAAEAWLSWEERETHWLGGLFPLADLPHCKECMARLYTSGAGEMDGRQKMGQLGTAPAYQDALGPRRDPMDEPPSGGIFSYRYRHEETTCTNGVA